MDIESKLFLAPMAGYTDLPFRLLAQENGADITVSEMISAKGLYYRDKKTENLLRTTEEEENFGVQIFGSEPEILRSAVGILKDKRDNSDFDFKFIDFNVGCPAPKIVKNGDGSALLKDLDLLSECVESIKNEAQDIPVSVKTRIGFVKGEENIKEVSEVIEKSGADFLTIHPRTRDQFYSGKSDWNYVRQIVDLRDIPVVLSGDINSPESAKEALETGADAIMIGRAALENPFLFQQIKQYLENGEYEPLSLEHKLEIINRHLDLCSEYKLSDRFIIELRKQLANYTKGLPGAAKIRRELFTLTDVNEVKSLFERLEK